MKKTSATPYKWWHNVLIVLTSKYKLLKERLGRAWTCGRKINKYIEVYIFRHSSLAVKRPFFKNKIKEISKKNTSCIVIYLLFMFLLEFCKLMSIFRDLFWNK